MTNIILVGYPGSQKIVPVSEYLTDKYIPQEDEFEITYLNYTGAIEGWAAYLVTYLSDLIDQNVIFSLDDYLIAAPIDMEKYRQAEASMGGAVVCVKLCKSTPQEHREYPVTTQYCLWNREYLIWLLKQVRSPWEFEIEGSKIFNKAVLLITCLDYYCNSSLSSKWKGVDMQGLNEEDTEYIQENLLEKEGKVTVFGGSGYLGTFLIERLIAKKYTNILAVARNEGALVNLKEKFPSISIMVGDIADPWVVKKAMVGAETCWNLSAMKHVSLAEKDVRSCVKTNILGTMNVIEESLITKPKILMFISSDKASQGTGIYGMSKKIGEKLMAEAQQINPDTKYRVVRYGNVAYSHGSVLCKWRDKMKKGEEIIVTDVKATRFFWSVSQAIDLIFDCIKNVKDATPFYTAMKSIQLGDLLEAMMQKYGQVPVKTIGLQPGENKHEIIADNIPDSFHSERYTKEEILELI